MSPHGDLFSSMQSSRARQSEGGLFGIRRGVVTDIDEFSGELSVLIPSLSADPLPKAKYCSPFGGDGAGWFFLPRIHDLVWVMFEEGDIARPIWLGYGFSKPSTSNQMTPTGSLKNNPPPLSDSDREKRVLITKSGMKLIFDDAKGVLTIEAERILLKNSLGLEVALGERDATIGGVVTVKTHPYCYITGQPIQGCFEVKADTGAPKVEEP